MSLPDSRAGSGYGASSKFTPPGAASLGSPYKGADAFPYTDKDIELEDEDEAMDDEDAEKALQQKVSLKHMQADPFKRRDYGSFAGSATRFDLHQGNAPAGDVLKSEIAGISGKSISPIPNLYHGRQAAGGMGGMSPMVMTTRPGARGGTGDRRGFASATKLPRDEFSSEKFSLVDIIFGDEEGDDYVDIIVDADPDDIDAIIDKLRSKE